MVRRHRPEYSLFSSDSLSHRDATVLPKLSASDVKTATVTTEALTQRMGPFIDQIQTLTTDNGKEFASSDISRKSFSVESR